MVIFFNENLNQALQEIYYSGEKKELIIHAEEAEAQHSKILNTYGEAKWQIVDSLNKTYSPSLTQKFDLYNWLNYNENDEVAYFLNEAGSNCLNYSEFKAPHKFHLWLGKKGFIIGIEQKGKGFDAEKVHQENIKQNEGAAFDFFRKCKSKIFFDDKNDAKIVFMEWKKD